MMSRRPTTRRWSEETIISLMRDWISLYGDPPTTKEWNHNPCYPGVEVVRYYFGNWTNAVRASGGNPRTKGCPSHLIQPPHRIKGKLAKSYVTA